LRRASTVKKRSDERTGSANTRPNSREARRRLVGGNPADVGTKLRRTSRSGSETGSPFCAAALEHVAAAPRGHAGAEPVGALAAQIARLKGSLHALGT
jgi:hypothetical protein